MTRFSAATTARRVATLVAVLAILLLLLQAAWALGYAGAARDDYGIFSGASLSQHEECEPGEVWVPSPTNPIAGECVAQ